MKVGIIIPTFNHWEYVALAIESASRTPGTVVIIVDDASATWPGERIIAGMVGTGVPYVIQRYQRHGGLSRSWNAGLRIARDIGCPYAVCGNSDVIFSEHWWEPIERVLQQVDFAGPVTNAPGHIHDQDVKRYLPNYECDDTLIDEAGKQCRELASSPAATSRLNGFCVAGRVASFFRVDTQPFASHLPMAGNEDDFFMRATQASLRSVIVPSSFVFHFRGVSRGLHQPRHDRGHARLHRCHACGRAE